MARRAKNLSVSQFQDLMANIPKAVADELVSAVESGAETMAGAMRSAVATGIDGRNELQESIRVTDGKHPLRKVIRAGGPLTTKDTPRGPYDYAHAVEFGTQEVTAQPFFYPSYRLLKNKLQAAINRKARKAIEKVVPLK